MYNATAAKDIENKKGMVATEALPSADLTQPNLMDKTIAKYKANRQVNKIMR